MNTNNFASNLKALRKVMGYTQKEMGAKLNILPQSYCNYENGKRIPSIDFIIQIADILKVPMTHLICGVVDPSGNINLASSPLDEEVAQILVDYLTLPRQQQCEIRFLMNFMLQNK